MVSLLLSVLSRMHRAKPLSEFAAAYPHCWLVWEPGVWRPPAKGGGTLAGLPTPVAAAHGAGEALALAMLAPLARPGQITLGRTGCDIEINDATLSHLHLVFMEAAPGVWTVRDAGSRNGSFVDQTPLATGMPMRLASGASIQAGQVCLSYYDAAGLYDRLFQAQGSSRLQTPGPRLQGLGSTPRG